MAQFNWKPRPESGQACITCGTQDSDRGFVDLIGEVNVVRESYEITGVVDALLCGYCIEQGARLVGSASKEETERMAEMVIEKEVENEKLKDEISAWQQRFINMASLDIKDFKALRELEEADKGGLIVPANSQSE